MNDPVNHPSLEDLARWALRAPGDSVPSVGLHVADCADCARRVHDLRRLAVTASSAAAADPPEPVIERARDLLRRAEPLVLVAQLIEDTREPVGVRGSGDARYLVYRAGDYDIDLRLDGGDVRGQVHGPPHASVDAIEVQALRGARSLDHGRTDDHGGFRLSRVTPPFFLRFVGGALRARTPDVTP